MTRVEPIIDLHPWLGCAPGRALLAWEQLQLDELVADIFGFHALQLGLPELDGLRANRMPHRWVALDATYQNWSPLTMPIDGCEATQAADSVPLGLRCDFEALPFPANSLDLVLLPHALELTRDPHRTLREVERVLVPDGRVVIAGFNPASLWGMKQRMARMGLPVQPVLPQGEFIGYWRLRDWLRLLGLEIEAGCFGCYRPLMQRESAWERLSWLERAGDRWWPVLGAVYFLVAVKRVRGMRLVGKVRKARVPAAAAPAVVTQRHQVDANSEVNG